MKKLLLLFTFLLSVYLSAQSFSSIPNCRVVEEKQFDGKSLWGHINGGADLYLEYGFKVLNFYDIVIDSSKFRVEIYTMEDNDAAYGIYSLMVFNCNENKNLKIKNCISKYQIQMLAENKYYSIVNEKGTEKEQRLTLLIAEKICESAKQGEVHFPEIFSNKLFENRNTVIRYFKGTLGLQNKFESWADYLADYSDYEVYILSIPLKESKASLGYIKFNTGHFPDIFPIQEGFDRSDDGTEMHYLKKNSNADVGILFIYNEPDNTEEEKYIKNILLLLENYK